MSGTIRSRNIAVAVLAGLTFAAMKVGPAAAATAINSCPVTISAPGDYVVTADLNCPGADAIRIESSNVRLDLQGHTITGNGTFSGVYLAPGVSGVAVTHGSIVDFYVGVWALDVSNVGLSRLRLRDHYTGIYGSGSKIKVLHCTLTGNEAWGVLLFGDKHEICQNRAFNNAWLDNTGAIELVGTNGTIACNTIDGTDWDGIRLWGERNIVYANSARNNTASGIAVFGDGNYIGRNKNQANSIGIYIDFGATKNTLEGNVSFTNGTDMWDNNLPSCVNTWRRNFFTTDNEGDGPSAGCVR